MFVILGISIVSLQNTVQYLVYSSVSYLVYTVLCIFKIVVYEYEVIGHVLSPPVVCCGEIDFLFGHPSTPSTLFRNLFRLMHRLTDVRFINS